ncbi:MAG: DUF494 family protein [Limnochordia bacterium]
MNNERLAAAIRWLVKEILEKDWAPTLVETAVSGLLEEGFDLKEIDAALELLSALPELIRSRGNLSFDLEDSQGLRILTWEERTKLSRAAQNWLLRLVNHELITRGELEEILVHVHSLEHGPIGISELKWIITQALEDETRAFLLITKPLGSN